LIGDVGNRLRRDLVRHPPRCLALGRFNFDHICAKVK
jgi:hypothetical protein